MRRRRCASALLAALVCAAGAAGQTTASAPSVNWQAVATALGRVGTEEDGVYRVTFPRTDLHVRAEGIPLRTGLGLISWVAFQKVGNIAVMMGDLVLREGEVKPVVTALSKGDIDVTAVHNHLLNETPRLMYVHFHAAGDAGKLAGAVRQALALTGTPLAAPPAPIQGWWSGGLDFSALEGILGHKGNAGLGLVTFTIPRLEQIRCCGAENDPLLVFSGITLGPGMGVASSIIFQGEGKAAVVAGDLVLLGSEVPVVVRAVTAYGIEVVALHSHMLSEQPRLFFLHFWGHGDASELAQGLRAALERTNSSKEK